MDHSRYLLLLDLLLASKNKSEALSALAFIAGGMNVVYQIERLPIMLAILIHGGVLYICYLITYLLNGWLETGPAPIIIFSAIFVVGYIAIWIIIYAATKKRTARVNELMREKRCSEAKK